MSWPSAITSFSTPTEDADHFPMKYSVDLHTRLAGCGKTTARLKMLSEFRDFRDQRGSFGHSRCGRWILLQATDIVRRWLTSLASPDCAGGLSYRQPRQR